MKNKYFLNYILETVDFYKKNGNGRRAQKYYQTFSRFRSFLNGKDITFDGITPALLEMWEQRLKEDGCCPNTISFYNRILRALYNKAVDEGITKDKKPFRKSYTGNEKTVKRAIPIGKVKEMAHLDLSASPSLDFARDMFLFSFYTRGMSFIDIAFLEKRDLHNGVLTYRRKKTGQRLFVKWEKQMGEILDKHRASGESKYMFDIIQREDKAWRDARNGLNRVNMALRKIGELMGLANVLTTYVGRHSWASACKASNIPLSVISEGMGHDSEETTRIYLASLDTSVVDKANRKIINQVI